jgi:hypothetical protein
MPGPDIPNVVAAAAGAYVGTQKRRYRTRVARLGAILTGTLCSSYLTPLIAKFAGWTSVEHQLGLSFLVGTLGLRSVEWLTTKFGIQAVNDDV